MKKLLFLFAAILIASSCHQKANEEEEICHVSVFESSSRVDDLASAISDASIIRLDDSHIVANVLKCLTLPNGDFIILGSAGIFRYSAQGIFISEYGGIGRGPGEYMKIFDMCTTLDNKHLICLNEMNQVLVYELDGGKYIKTIETNAQQLGLPNGTGLMPGEDGSFFIYFPNPVELENPDTDFNCVVHFSSDGEKIEELMKWTDFNVDFSFVPFVTRSNTAYLIRPQENENILYCIENGEFSQRIKIDFGEKNIPPRYAYSTGENPWMRLEDMLESDYYKHQFNHYLSGDNIYFSAFGPHSVPINCVYDLKAGKGIYWDSSVSRGPLLAAGSDGEFVYFVFDKLGDLDPEEVAKDPLMKYIVQNMGLVLPESSNPALVKIRFKL